MKLTGPTVTLVTLWFPTTTSEEDGIAFPVQQETQWEAAVPQAMGQHTDVKRMEEAGLTEHIQAFRKEKFQEQFASLGLVVAVAGRKQLK